MLELFTESIKLVNLPYTILLGFVCMYWVLYLIGAVGSDALDFLGLDFDVDADVDADVDLDTGSHGPGQALASVLQFLYVGELPVALIGSILITFMWAFSVLSNYYLNYYLGYSAPWFGLLLFVPIFVVGAIATKAVVMPLAPYLKRAFDQSSDRIEVVGKQVTIISMKATPEYGQAEFTTAGAPLLLNVKTREGVTMAKGEEAIVYEYDKASNTYLVAKFDINTAPELEE